MNDTVGQIKALIVANRKTASAMTTALKQLGNGDMQTGITRIAAFCFKEGINVGVIRGAIGGVAGTLAVGALVLLVRKAIKGHRFHKEEGEAILKALEDNIVDYEKTDNSEPTSDATSEDEQR